jgi:enoyl-CoA hydratase
MTAINKGMNMALEEGQILEANLAGFACVTEDAKEGVQAFIEKRRPQSRGK